MNDEIKELIEELKDSYGIAMPKQEYFGYIKGIEDYITNLQQRIEKAVEYIKNCPEYLWENVNTKELLNILNGKSDE